MNQFPQRHQNHSLESRSELFLKNHLPLEWIVDKPTDYGIDFKIDIVINRQVIGQNFSLQLKAHEHLPKGKLITATLERTTINLFLARLEPILVVCYIAEQNEGYYTWFTENSVDLTKNNQSYSLRFDPSNKVSNLDWNIISTRVEEIFSRRCLLHSFPEINYSNMELDERDAATYYLKGDYETAGYLYKQLQKKKPSGCWLNSIAMCHYALYQYKDALNYINLALAVNDLDEIKINKASILAEYGMEIGNKAMVLEAREIFSLEIDKTGNSNRHYNYANTLSFLGEDEEAKKHFKKAIKLNPNYAEAWKNLGEIYSRHNDITKEFECYDKALLINPRLPQALLCKGIALLKEGINYLEGKEYLMQTLCADPELFNKYKSGYFWFAYAHFKTHNDENGLHYLAKGLEHYPGDQYLLNMKRDYFKDNWQNSLELVQATKDFMQYLLELEPRDSIALECLCRIYLNEKDKTNAMEQIRKHTVLFRRSTNHDYTNKYFNVEPFLDSLYNYHYYCDFRKTHPLEKDLNSDLSPTFYFEFSELIGLKIFHEGMKFIKMYRLEKNFEKSFITHQLEQSVIYYPQSAPFLITAKVDERTAFGEQMCSAIVHIPILAIRETARVIGYLATKYNLNKSKMDVAIKRSREKEASEKIAMSSLQRIEEYYHFFPEK